MWVNSSKGWQFRVYQIILSWVLIFPVYADIVTDGTVGQAQDLTGPNFTIPESLGTRAGANLFHSFQRFNIFQGESATFTGSESTANVISRVTGGQASTINGLLRSTVGKADFYFINPAGVMFGANAKIDVPASFNVSTADELRFPKGEVFSATDPTASTLSIDQPHSFGFLGDQTAKINVVGSTLELNPGKTLALSAGELEIDSSSLSSEAGEIQLVAVGDIITAVKIDSELSEPAHGDLNISNSLIKVDGNGAGRISIQGGQSDITSSSVFANNTGSLDASSTQGIDISTSSLQVSSSKIKTDTTGKAAADLSVTVDNQLFVVNGGEISSNTSAAGDAGDVTVNAGQMQIDGQGFVTGIFSSAFSGSSGNAGKVNVMVADQLSVDNGAEISSNIFANTAGNAGDVTVNARQLQIDGQGFVTGIFSSAFSESTGNAGKVDVKVTDQLSVVYGGEISGKTFAAGNAGDVTVYARQLLVDGQSVVARISSSVLSGSTGNAGKVNVTVTDQLSVVDAGEISSTTTAGHAGDVTVNAGQLLVDGQGLITGIFSTASSGSSGNAGKINVTVDDQLSIVKGGEISSITFAAGDAGDVTIDAGQFQLDGQGFETGIISSAFSGSTGNAGKVVIDAKDQLSVLKGGSIVSLTKGAGDANTVTVNAANLLIDSQGANIPTGISASAGKGSSGNSGAVLVEVTEKLSIVNKGQITSDTFSSGNAGEVTVKANQLLIDGQGLKPVSINGQKVSPFTGISSTVNPVSKGGNGGRINVDVIGKLSIVNGGAITSVTGALGDAGQVKVNAGQLLLDGQDADFAGISSAAKLGSSGNAGIVVIDVIGQLTLIDGGVIGSDTFAKGHAGGLSVKAGQLLIDNQESISFTGIATDAVEGSIGNAGNISVQVTDHISVINGGEISSSTFSAGKGGSVKVAARSGNIFIDRQGSQFLTGISSRAGVNSSGQAGTVTLDTKNLFVANGAKISIESFPTVDTTALVNIKPRQININAENITLTNSSITTESSGNVPAGSIILNVTDTLSLDPSSISTAANDADGGAISIRARIIDLQDSQITTSVSGQGNGGDISLDSDNLVLDSGFIQANTSGISAKGGDIQIDTKALVASNDVLLTGGDTPLRFEPGINVIQAAAPDGISGNINITSPQLDISGDLIDMDSELLDVEDLTQNPCATVGGRESTLVKLGRGGLPESPQQAGSIVITPERLQHLLPLTDDEPVPQSGSSLHPDRPTNVVRLESNKGDTWVNPDCS